MTHIDTDAGAAATSRRWHPFTVAELREALAGLPDHLPVHFDNGESGDRPVTALRQERGALCAHEVVVIGEER